MSAPAVLSPRAAPARPAGPALRADELYRFFHVEDLEVAALRGVSLTVRAGEILAVTGPSGSGKSTLLACLAGLDDPDGGRVDICGSPMSRRPEPERAALRARHIGVLLQHGNLLEHLTVLGNVTFTQRLNAARPAVDATQLLAELGLAGRASARPSQLSGGQLARAGLAVALANDPQVLLADEPTGEVDGRTEAGVLELLRRRAELGAAVVIVTHSPAVAAAADREVTLQDGKVRP